MAALRKPLLSAALAGLDLGGARCQQGAAVAAQVQQQLQLQQVRGAAHNAGISVDVHNGNVDKAWKVLGRKLKDEDYITSAQERLFYTKPSERRKQAASAARRRFQRQEFQDMLAWIMRRRNRGF